MVGACEGKKNTKELQGETGLFKTFLMRTKVFNIKLLSLTLWHPTGVIQLMGYKKFSVEIDKNGAGFGVSKKFPNDECQCLHYRLKHGQIV